MVPAKAFRKDIRRFMAQTAAAFLVLIVLSACGGGPVGYVQTPSGMNIQRGRNYREVVEDFEDKGFTNIRTEKIEDLLYGWSIKVGEVEEITVGGDADYDAGVSVPADTEVVIRYHATRPYTEEEEAASSGEDTP